MMSQDDSYGSVLDPRTPSKRAPSSFSYFEGYEGYPGTEGEHDRLRSEIDPCTENEERAKGVTSSAFPCFRESPTMQMKLLIYAGFAAAVLASAAVLALLSSQSSNLVLKDTDAVEYDFIVVGGGPAGAVIARRLSDDPTNRVLLLEAGVPSQYELGGRDFLSNPLTPFDIPLMWSSVSHMQDVHWEVRDHTKPGRPDALLAKALGGCGIHNAMLYVRGLESDFEKWGLEGFDYASATEIWKSLENYTGPGELPWWHGGGGPIETAPPSFVDEVAPFFLQSCEASGIELTDDFNKPGGRTGAGYYDFTVRNGVRDSAARAMLGEIITRKDTRSNLDLLTEAHVDRVLLERKAGGVSHAAVGVEYTRNGETHATRISLEGSPREHGSSAVVLTAGALHTPKVLISSGIGNKRDLEAYGLRVLVDIPGLGRNLQDHPSVGVIYTLGPDLLNLSPSAYTVAQELERYKASVLKAFDMGCPPGEEMDSVDPDPAINGREKTPSIFSSAGLSAGAFLKSPFRSHPKWANSTAPDVQLTAFPRVTEPHILALANVRPSAQASPMMLVTVAVLDPEGRSMVRLDPDDPVHGNPYISADDENGAPEPLSDLDAKKLAWGLGEVRRIMMSPPLREMHKGEVYPGPGFEGYDGKTAAENSNVVNWVREHLYSNSHWCGTARMGPASRTDTVVSEGMEVKGVSDLFVGDASLLPYIPNGNVHATVLLVAQKLATMLVERAARARRVGHRDKGAF